jgi:hypothetical protein
MSDMALHEFSEKSRLCQNVIHEVIDLPGNGAKEEKPWNVDSEGITSSRAAVTIAPDDSGVRVGESCETGPDSTLAFVASN